MNALSTPPSTRSAAFTRSTVAFNPRDLLPFGTAIAAFLIDIQTPNGVIDGFLYVLAVLACVGMPRIYYAPLAALGLTLPMILGFALSPGDGPSWAAVTNRLVGLLAVWLTAFVLWSNARSAANREAVVTELQRRVSAAERASHEERIELSAWLNQEIGRELEIVDWQLNTLPHRARRSSDVTSEAIVLRRVIERAKQSVRGKAIRLQDAGVVPDDNCTHTAINGLRINCGDKFAWNDLEPFVGA